MAGSISPVECARGSYSDRKDLSECKPCEAGRYCAAGLPNPNPNPNPDPNANPNPSPNPNLTPNPNPNPNPNPSPNQVLRCGLLQGTALRAGPLLPTGILGDAKVPGWHLRQHDG